MQSTFTVTITTDSDTGLTSVSSETLIDGVSRTGSIPAVSMHHSAEEAYAVAALVMQSGASIARRAGI